MAEQSLHIIDDRKSNDLKSSHLTEWRLITDKVMGGASHGHLTMYRKEGRNCLRLLGDVSLNNNGGFIQAALDLVMEGNYDASHYAGLLLDVYGNNETYNIHLRTNDLSLPWQAYRQSFKAKTQWQTLRLPFTDFKAYGTDTLFNPDQLRRIGVVAIGKEFHADVCISFLAFYRH
ncbi:CIA30 family protein [Kaarinaea lacus]